MENVLPEGTEDQYVTSPSGESLGRNLYVRCSEHIKNLHSGMTRGLGAKLCACASASSAQNSQYAQLTHSATIENRVSDLRRHAHFNI